MSARPSPHRSPAGQRVAAGLRHDLRHELATLRTLLAVARDDVPRDPDRLRALLATASSEASYALELLDALPETVAPPAPAGGGDPAVGSRTDVAGVLRDAVAATAAGDRSIRVEAAGPLPVALPRTALTRVVRNLLGNAVAATTSDGTVLLRAERTGADGHVRLEVHDDGPGPGRTGFTRSGGRGLQVVRTLVLPAGGWLVLGRSTLGGTCASVTFPATPQETSS